MSFLLNPVTLYGGMATLMCLSHSSIGLVKNQPGASSSTSSWCCISIGIIFIMSGIYAQMMLGIASPMMYILMYSLCLCTLSSSSSILYGTANS
jgi:hypothetical protein